MKTTNNFDAPEALVEFAKTKHERYNKGDADYSVTGLLKPVQQRRLQGQHFDELTEDIADSINLLFGEAIHYILEKYTKKGLTEERLFMTIDGNTISGQFDNFSLATGTLTDYKSAKCSQYRLTQSDHEAQLNMYAYLLRENDYDVKHLEVVKIFKDWSTMTRDFKGAFDVKKNQWDGNYPPAPWETTELELWAPDRTLDFIRGRLRANEAIAVDCTDHERWKDADKFAVIKIGGKRASRVFTDKSEAGELLKEKGDEYKIEFRKGMSKRCLHWCNVSEFCEQYQSENAEK